ncbi:MAG: UDP-N-acetylmuramoyl-tripeptide--D-alanyl-D-alanine ligase [Stenotrophomonas nitritireducens]|uniref:UDP-N-acetylmuramoyl-tripeptide--D-alanyl-D- alanine ligase n=1 Tax=Stenotrophomonas nitritireducens TaxID=83617 RepID=UPI001ACFEC19|nr:UDP-N-acetylmuramoyl-tripeptide--D-alanyl-D-alanine ligase [Stenotrophomonas nitritireducens]MBN8791345.1 UDP-N-acetylmuramoyl-tripeptide--D-alanyl-D-alanine ligase [Stenotrophomonas nitritireducens]MBN8795287.1 UDP-N-acetylmuramoyl-tripeptide--D-alanyl-D-alanine ligase [Stenotrophomonas nitritireducens]
MKRTPLSLIAHWAGGELHGEDASIDAIGNDTRTLAPGSLYLALRGERFDGHDFAAGAVENGASALLVERLLPLDVPQVVVADAERALAKIATAMQRDRATRVFAITGSNGKTSVKALLLAILQNVAAVEGRTIHATPGNRNNEIGMPLAVIDAPEDADFAVYEMGTGKPGDIAWLTAIAAPDVALVNNVAPAHLERMGSLLEIANTKAAVYDDLREGGVAVVNADDAFAPFFAERAGAHRVIRFGLEASADVTATGIALAEAGSRFRLHTPQGEAEVALQLPGRHNVLNALAAASLALAAGIALPRVAEGLAQARPVAGRQVARVLGNGAVLVDDSYNANPGSLAAGKEEGWLVLGDMRELGPDAQALHAQAGVRAREAGLKRLYALGPLSAAAAAAFGEGGRHFDSHAALAAALAADLHAGVRCLVKGSRGSAMDKIVTALLGRGEDTPHVA